MNIDITKILNIVELNFLCLLHFSIIYFVFATITGFMYTKFAKRASIIKSILSGIKFSCFLIRFKYPLSVFTDLTPDIFNDIKVLFAQIFIPISHMNAFWANRETLKLSNAEHKANKGTITLKEIILSAKAVSILYEIVSDDKKCNLVKDKKKTILTVNDKDYFCDVDTESKIINVDKLSGYCVFDDTQLILHSNLRYDSPFDICIKISFSDYHKKQDIKTSTCIQACNFLCQLCFLVCFFVILLCFIDGWNFISIILIDYLILRSLSSFSRRLFDVINSFIQNDYTKK